MSTTSAQAAIDYAHARRAELMAGFQELLTIPSISTDPAYKTEVERCADWIVAEMARIGFQQCRRIPTAGHPVVYGEWLEAGPDQPTVLIYAHYDVQPVDPLGLWQSSPFEPTIRDGKIFARGTLDDKSGVWANLKACEAILATDGKLPVNVKLFFEGEEETGSPHMQSFVEEHQALLAADALLICDGPFDPEQPTIPYALRGMVAAEVLVRGADHDLHSGVFGGAIHNPIHLVGQMVGSFHDANGRILIPGFYDRVRKLSETELAALQEAWTLSRATWTAKAGVKHLWGETLASQPERLTALPTLDVNGIWGGYQGQGIKTVIPAQAGFKVTMRLVADQDPHEIGELFKAHLFTFACPTLAIEVDIQITDPPLTMAREHPVVEAVQRTFATTLGKRALLTRLGGSLPIGGMFQQTLGIPMTSIGLCSGAGGHAPNEYINEEHFYLGIDAAIHFYYYLAETMAGASA